MKTKCTFCAVTLLVLFALSSTGATAQVAGSGTTNTIPKWTGSTTLGNSSISEDGAGNVKIGKPVAINSTLYVFEPTGTKWAVFASGDYVGLAGRTSTGAGVVGTTDMLTAGGSGDNIGVLGVSLSGVGVKGVSYSSDTIHAGVVGTGVNGVGVFGESQSSDKFQAGVVGLGVRGGAYAGWFLGNVSVTGTLSKAGGSFKIDHPLDPENRYLYHSFVESPDMKNIYDGVVVLDSNGDATVELPEWFQALNRDFRYLLTPIGAPGPGLYIAEEISNNRFRVAGGAAGMKVSWQVTGIRQDAWAKKNRIPVEEKKPELERGFYLHPEAFDQPEERGIKWAHDQSTMKQLKDGRVQVKLNKQYQDR